MLLCPIKAGLAAYMLSYPWPAGQNPFSLGGDVSVGRRMKTMLADTYAYQRLPRDKLIAQSLENIKRGNQDHEFPYEVPARVNVAYNMAYGPQKCKEVEGFPNLKRDGDSCPTPGSGGADGESTGSIFYTGEPTYMSSGWSGFSTATGAILSSADNITAPTVVPSTSTLNMTTPGTSSTFTTTTRTDSSSTSSPPAPTLPPPDVSAVCRK
jgi:hypothetical protein